MSQPVSESLAILSASVVPALEATASIAAKVSADSSEYIAARHRLDAVLDDAAQLRGQKRAAAADMLSKKRSLGADLVESSQFAGPNGASSPEGLSVTEVCDGVVQVTPRCYRHDTAPLISFSGARCHQIRRNTASRPVHWLLGQQTRS